MPSHLHEALLLLFRNRPELAAELLREALHIDLPAYAAVRVEAADLTDIVPAEYRADLVVLLLVNDKPVFGIVFEVQLRRHARKRFTWPVYQAELRARFQCPIAVLVLSPKRSVARWAAKPIPLGPGSVCQVLALGPDAIPIITEPTRARREPELAVLSAMAHGRGDVQTAIRIALAAGEGLEDLHDPDRVVLYSDLINDALGAAARKAFEMIPAGYRIRTKALRDALAQGRNEGRSEGEVRGQRAAVLAVLESRGFVLSTAERERILEMNDAQTLQRWLSRVARVGSAQELWAEVPSAE
ncbi:MAG: hypothetical protein ACOY0T_01595 [Myxococcota bacterium]